MKLKPVKSAKLLGRALKGVVGNPAWKREWKAYMDDPANGPKWAKAMIVIAGHGTRLVLAILVKKHGSIYDEE